MKATGIQIHDRESGKDYALHDDCLPAMDKALADQGAPGAFDPFTGQLTVIGPMLGYGWQCVYCRMEAIKPAEESADTLEGSSQW